MFLSFSLPLKSINKKLKKKIMIFTEDQGNFTEWALQI